MLRLVNRLGLVAVVVAGCGGAARPMPDTYVASRDPSPLPAVDEPAAGPPLVRVGEQMAYRVSLHGVPLAELVIDAGGIVPIGDRAAMQVEVRVDTQALASLIAPVHDRFTTWIDVVTGRPLQFHAREAAAKDGGALEETAARFARGQYAVRLVVGDAAGGEEVQVVRGTPFDFAAFLVFMRSWEAAQGSELTVDIMRSRFVWRVRVVVAARGNLETALGALPVVRFEGEGVRLLRDGTVDPTSDRRRFTIWISDDADRVPVKLAAHTDYGDVLLELGAYQAGQ